MELLSQWGISGFMEHVAKVEEFYRGRRDRMQQAAEKHLTGKSLEKDGTLLFHGFKTLFYIPSLI